MSSPSMPRNPSTVSARPNEFPWGTQTKQASPASASGVSALGRASVRQSGFATILVLLLIFLMMTMVITYLRTMRSYNATHPPRVSANALPVAQQVVTDLAAIIGADGNMNIGYAEPYDYPWTCTRRNAAYRLTYPTTASGTDAMGDPKVDDAWLAPIEPEGGVWAQVSNPFGSFLVYGASDFANTPPNFATRDRVPMDAPAGFSIPGVAIDGSGSPQSVKFQNLSVSDPRLVDTDGDGVGDALWFYPQNAWKDGARYVAAVRVIDPSGMLNLNTALGEFANTGTPRKGEGAYEINPAPVVGAMPAASKTFRQTGVGALPSGRAPAAWTDWDYWYASGANTQNNGTSAGAGNNRYSLADEVQLRDLANQYTATPFPSVRGHYPALKDDLTKRRYVTTLSGVNDIYAPIPNAYGMTIWDGSSGSSFYYQRRPFDILANQNTYSNPDAPSAQQVGAAWSGFSNGGWWDQAQFYESGWYGVSNLLRGIATNGYDATTVTKVPYPYPAGYLSLMNAYAAPVNEDTRALQYQIQMGATCMQDVLSRDNLTTVAGQWMGWEPVPVMTEFYAQMPYVVFAPYTKLPLGVASTPVLVFPNTHLANLAQKDIENLAGCISWDTTPRYRAGVYFYNQTATQITFRYQAYANDGNGNWTRSADVKLTQTPAGVVALSPVAGKYIAGDHRGEDPTGWPGTDNNYAGFFGLPNRTGTSPATAWNQIYVNLTANRTATGGAGTAGGDIIFGGNNLTSTDWRASGSAGIGSYAVELCNPYAIPIRMNNVRFNFRRQDWHIWETFRTASTPSYSSLDLGAYVRALPPAGMAQDSEGFYVLKPGERIVFYRNGLELNGPGGPRRKPFGGTPDVSPLIPAGAGVYKVDLGATIGLGTPAITAAQVPDINGYPSTWNVGTIELQVATKFSSGVTGAGNSQYGWMDHQRLTFQSLFSAWDAGNNCYKCESNVPDGRQGAPGDLVYKQIDARAFGVSEGLDALQFRPPVYRQNNQMPTDMGDEEFRTNTYAQVGSGILPNGSKGPYPDGGATLSTNGWNYGCNNTATSMPLIITGAAPYNNATVYAANDPVYYADALNAGASYRRTNNAPGTAGNAPPNPLYWTVISDYHDYSTTLSALGQVAKVSFPSPAGVALNPMYGGSRQSIKNEPTPPWNYVGVPGGPFVHPVTGASELYPGTFPELNAAAGAQMALRDNPNAGGGQGGARKDGVPRPLDLVKFPLIGPIYDDHWPGSWIVGNCNFRGNLNAGGGWTGTGIPDATNPLTGHWSQNTFGDALNFYLVKDTAQMGLRGLSLRTDMPWFDWANAAVNYPVLPYNAATSYVLNQEAMSGGEVYVAQNAGNLPVPDPTPVTGNVGTSKSWGYSNRAYARASQFWQVSWAQALASRWQVDSPAYKGKTLSNGTGHKPGMLNINTAPASVLACLSLPPGVSSATVATAIMNQRKAPAAGASVAGGVRKGLVIPSEAFGPAGMKSYTTNAALLAGAGTARFYGSDANLNLETLSWLPQQATCRSDIFCAYVVVQGYNEKDFTLDPVDSVRLIAIFSRDGSGNPAAILGSYNIVRRKATDGDANDWYTP